MSRIYFFVLLCTILIAAATIVEGEYSAPIPSSPALPTRDGRNLKTRHGVVELDLKRAVRKRMAKRTEPEGRTTSSALGDALDITYNVEVLLGEITTPLVLDTGSADLWVLSDDCSLCFNTHYPLYKSKTFSSVADARLLYGDSRTGTHAFGRIGADCSGIAGIVVDRQYFAAINETNTSVLDTGSAGIVGLGFPVNSILWNKLYAMTAYNSSSTSKRALSANTSLYSRQRMLPTNNPSFHPVQDLATKDNATTPGYVGNGINILTSFSTYGPLVSRLVLERHDSQSAPFLALPQFTVMLQRTIPAPSGNVGSLTLGGLPDGVDNGSLIWSPVRLYTEGQNGVVIPQASRESYPYAWEVALEEVYFDGIRLPVSTRGDILKAGVGCSALIDTGNSLIRGPADVIISILSLLRNSTASALPLGPSWPLDISTYSEEDYNDFTENFDPVSYAYPCAEAHSLVFQFSDRKFRLDPRDFGRPLGDEEARWCVPNLAPTDPPYLGGYLYSWSLGEPFLRGVLSSFYYGNLTHPSSDPPRIGFLSTVPDDAALRLALAVESAQSIGAYFESTMTAPTGTHANIAVTTSPQGIVQASEPPLPSYFVPSTGSYQGQQESGTSCLLCSMFGTEFGLKNGIVTCALLILFEMGFLL